MYFRDVVVWWACFQGKEFVTGSQTLLRPVLRMETDRYVGCSAMGWPFHDGAFDQAGVQHHQGFGAVDIFHGGLSAWLELAPRGAFAIEQRFPSDNVYPLVD